MVGSSEVRTHHDTENMVLFDIFPWFPIFIAIKKEKNE